MNRLKKSHNAVIVCSLAFSPNKPLNPHDALNQHSASLNFLKSRVFKTKTFMELVYNNITFAPISSHLHPLQVENCDSNSRLVMDADDNGKFKLERVKTSTLNKMGNYF